MKTKPLHILWQRVARIPLTPTYDGIRTDDQYMYTKKSRVYFKPTIFSTCLLIGCLINICQSVFTPDKMLMLLRHSQVHFLSVICIGKCQMWRNILSLSIIFYNFFHICLLGRKTDSLIWRAITMLCFYHI